MVVWTLIISFFLRRAPTELLFNLLEVVVEETLVLARFYHRISILFQKRRCGKADRLFLSLPSPPNRARASFVGPFCVCCGQLGERLGLRVAVGSV